MSSVSFKYLRDEAVRHLVHPLVAVPQLGDVELITVGPDWWVVL